jgi:hypothetical protein
MILTDPLRIPAEELWNSRPSTSGVMYRITPGLILHLHFPRIVRAHSVEMIPADFRVAGRLVDFKVVETLRAMVAALALLAELQEAGIDKSRFSLKK